MGHALALRSGIALSVFFSFSSIPTNAQLRVEPSPFPPRMSPFSTLPMPRLPEDPAFPVMPPIMNPEVRARYYVNVADYGALTGLAFDDTTAIQSAINAACNPISNGGYFGRPILFFPPGVFQVYQPQLPSTNSPLNIPCTLEIEGSGYTKAGQFSVLGPGSWIFVSPGQQPNAAATLTYVPYTNAIIRSINIAGINQAVSVTADEPALFEDVCLSVQTTGMPDNTALKATDTFWLWYKGGCLQTISTDVPVAMFTAETLPVIPNAGRVVGLVFFSDMITSGGGFKYIQRVPSNGPVPGNFVFRNITMEEAPDAFEITQEFSGYGTWRMSSLTFDNVATADSTCANCAVINMNAPDLLLSGVLVHNSFAGTGNTGPAIKVSSGLLEDQYVDACAYVCSASVQDGNGNPVWTYSGRVVLSGGTKTLQFYPIFFHDVAPVCVPNDETTLNGAMITTTLSSMTITGGTSDVVGYACFTNNPLGYF